MTVALSIAIFATTYESDKSLKWKLWFYGRPKSPTAAWVAVMATLGAGGDLWVVAGSLDLVKLPMDQLHYAVQVSD